MTEQEQCSSHAIINLVTNELVDLEKAFVDYVHPKDGSKQFIYTKSNNVPKSLIKVDSKFDPIDNYACDYAEFYKEFKQKTNAKTVTIIAYSKSETHIKCAQAAGLVPLMTEIKRDSVSTAKLSYSSSSNCKVYAPFSETEFKKFNSKSTQGRNMLMVSITYFSCFSEISR